MGVLRDRRGAHGGACLGQRALSFTRFDGVEGMVTDAELKARLIILEDHEEAAELINRLADEVVALRAALDLPWQHKRREALEESNKRLGIENEGGGEHG